MASPASVGQRHFRWDARRVAAGTGELLTSGPVERRQKPRLRRWLILLALVAVGVVPVGRFIRDALDRSALRRLETVWAERGATHDALAMATSTVDEAAAAPQDRALARRAVAALQREDAARLHTLARTAASATAYGRTRRIRSDVAAALLGEQRALVSAADAGTEVDAGQLVISGPALRVESDFAALHRQSPTAIRLAPVHLHAADSALRQLSRLLDVPLPIRLLVHGPDSAAILDLATSRVQAVPAVPTVPDGGGELVRGSYLVTTVLPRVFAVPLAGGAAKPIADDASIVLPGPRPDEVWVGSASSADATLIDVTGRVLLRITLPGVLRGAVGSGLVVGEHQLSVWDPVRRRTVRRFPGCASLLDASGNEVVLSSCRWEDAAPFAPSRVLDVATGRQRTLRMPQGEYLVSAANLAPDGRHLALAAAPSSGVEQLFAADVVTGAMSPVPTPDAFSVAEGVVWTADSRRLFFSVGAGFDAPAASLWTYSLGDRTATPVRSLRRGPVTPLAVLPGR